MKILSLNLNSRKKGMSLIEVLVSLLIFAILMAGVILILQLQQSRAVSVRSQAVLHTEAQVALSILKWDIFMAGYAIEQGQWAIQDGDAAGPLPLRDALTLRGGVLGLESRRGRWNQMLEGVSGLPTVYVRRWDDPDLDFIPNDTVIIADMNTKRPIDTAIVILNKLAATTPRGEPAWMLTLSRPISAAMGSFLFMTDHATFRQGVRYEVQPITRAGLTFNALVRVYQGRNEILLENVEDFQVQYGIDLNYNGLIEDPGEWFDNLPLWARGANQDTLRSFRFMIRFGIINTTDRPIPNYQYPTATINFFNHLNRNLTDYERMFRRVIMVEEVVPRNLRS